MDEKIFRAQIPHALSQTSLPDLGPVRRGKVRDIYELPDREALLFVTSDRVSAFDVGLGTIPFKGELLTGLAASWFARTADVCRNHLIDRPDPSAMVVRRLEPVQVEVVLRGFLTGSLWRDYQTGRHTAYGIELPPGLQEGHAFDEPLVTPTTKAHEGHDLPISEAELLSRGLVERRTWSEIVERGKALFLAGQAWARKQGLELVDTKYEFGLDASGGVWLMDEIHTPDSSRYWEQTPEGRKQLDKEFLRQWLLSRGWSGDGEPPFIPDETRVELALRYARLFVRLEGREPELHPGPSAQRLEANLRRAAILRS